MLVEPATGDLWDTHIFADDFYGCPTDPHTQILTDPTDPLNQWKYLVRFIGFGEFEIDNNLVENAIRPIAIGRKNWMFIGHPDAGDRSAIIYSIIASCYRLGIEPYEYLTDVLKRPIKPLANLPLCAGSRRKSNLTKNKSLLKQLLRSIPPNF